MNSTDVIYVAASAHDARFTRICVASIRRFYPSVRLEILSGGPLEPGLADELERVWNVGLARIPDRDWGWGFVKLLPLFGPAGERFMVVDSDTAFAGPVLESGPDQDADFVVDDEEQSEANTRRLYYDWEKVAKHDVHARKPAFVFNSGQWFGTAGLISRDDFDDLIDWSGNTPQLKLPDCFMPGDQGVLNYVLNQKAALHSLKVARRKIMHWPGHGMAGFDADTIWSGRAAPVVIHWAGLKKATLAAMPGCDVLRRFERAYYAVVPGGGLLRRRRALAYAVGPVVRAIRRRLGMG